MAGKLVGWKYGAFIASVVGFTGLALYPIAIEPMMNADKWRKYRVRPGLCLYPGQLFLILTSIWPSETRYHSIVKTWHPLR